MIVEGNPAEVRAINSIAMMRRGYATSTSRRSRTRYRRLYRENGGPMAEKIESLRRDYPDVPAVRVLCDSLLASGDGVKGRALELRRPDDKFEALRTALRADTRFCAAGGEVTLGLVRGPSGPTLASVQPAGK